MGTKQNPVTADGGGTPSGVVVSPSAPGPLRRLWTFLRRLDRRVQIALAVLVLLVLGVAAWMVFHQPAPVVRAALPKNVDNDYASTELANYPLLLNHDYGLTEDDIMHGNLHRELKTFDQAYNIAIAIARLGNRPRSLDAYKIAVSKAPKDTDVSFYTEVMGVSYQVGDKQYAEEMYQKAVAKIQNSKMTDAEKKQKLAHLKGLYDLLKQGVDS